jgi:hypothetical protein
MPITYIVKALQEVTAKASWTADLTVSLLVTAGFIVLALILGALSLRK